MAGGAIGIEAKPLIENWGDFGPYLWHDIQELRRLQSGSSRDLDFERHVAGRTTGLIRAKTKNWHSDFSPTAKVTSDVILYSNFYSPSILEDPAYSYLREWGERFGKNVTLRQWDEPLIDSYLGKLETGEEIGYPQELGNRWFLTLGDQRGSFYVPIEEITALSAIGF